ncbi:lysozyme [Novosphingobium sp. ST904]|uniref:lysozyme n=1 Tax=Novosphingobium sp. ST904 TaxID=1684385 RepID=UPI0009EBB8BA|nr:lysozyme [Novosphingobium sp. ST904]TCM37715.1 lysozyme [Novosphingobium sp. ST904]
MDADKRPPLTLPKKGSLAAVVGISAAAMLLRLVPEEESGRTVAVQIEPDGKAQVIHISGRQYLTAYLDIAGVGTACDGITSFQGMPIRKGQVFDETQCAAMLERELVKHAEGVMRCTPFNTGTQPYQITAAVSFAYNVGVGSWCGSTAAKRFKAGDITGMCDWLLPWNKARVKGVLQPVTGLSKRRNRERQYCLTGTGPTFTPTTLNARLQAFR